MMHYVYDAKLVAAIRRKMLNVKLAHRQVRTKLPNPLHKSKSMAVLRRADTKLASLIKKTRENLRADRLAHNVVPPKYRKNYPYKNPTRALNETVYLELADEIREDSYTIIHDLFYELHIFGDGDTESDGELSFDSAKKEKEKLSSSSSLSSEDDDDEPDLYRGLHDELAAELGRSRTNGSALHPLDVYRRFVEKGGLNSVGLTGFKSVATSLWRANALSPYMRQVGLTETSVPKAPKRRNG